MTFSYRYNFVDYGKKAGSRRPTVPININGYGFTGLVDSGSDSIVIPLEIAKALNLKEEDSTELCQLDGTLKKCAITGIDIEFGKGHEKYNFKVKALITQAPRVILGRQGFFNHFRITFDELNSNVSFRANSGNNTKIYINRS